MQIDLSFVSHWAIGFLDFSKKTYSVKKSHPESLFDLASLTKPLTLALWKLCYPLYWKGDHSFSWDLLLNHRASFPSYARLAPSSYKEFLLKLVIKESEAIYSDLMPLRLQLEIEKTYPDYPLYSLLELPFMKEIKFWKDLTLEEKRKSAPTGFRNKKIIQGEVNDENAFVLGNFLSHAGLFSSIEGVCQALIGMEKNFDLCNALYEKLSLTKKRNLRFCEGFDTSYGENPKSLAGQKHSGHVFGHLGFTGTCFWIDAVALKGLVFLTNASYPYSYNKDLLNKARATLADCVWMDSCPTIIQRP